MDLITKKKNMVKSFNMINKQMILEDLNGSINT